MGKIIAVYNQKGGVGKTTTTVNLAASVGALGKKVLIVDIDPQGNTTSGLGVDKRAVAHSTYDLLLGSCTAEDALVTLPFKNLSILPADVQLTGVEIELVNVPRRESRLKAALVPMRDAFDYIFIDCPPSLGILALNTLCAADTVIIPIQCEYYALEGLTQLMTTLRKVQLQFNPTLDLEGVLLTMYDSRLKLTQQVADFAQNGPSETNMAKVKEYMVKKYQENLRNNGYFSRTMKEYLLNGVDNCTDYEKVLNSITVNDVRVAVADLLKQNNKVKVVMHGIAK